MMKSTYLALMISAVPMAAMAGGMAQPLIEPTVVMPVAPVMMSTADWSGAYAGGTLGFGRLRADQGFKDQNQGIAGVNLGYRHDFGQVVLGGELGYTMNDLGIKGSDNHVKRELTAQLQLGADLGRTLVYVAGGVSRADIKLGPNTGHDNGYFAGIGADYALNNQWTVGGELVATKYNDFDNTGVDLNNSALLFKVNYNF